MAIGRRIRDARERADLRQEALAAILGVERRTVQRIERGETDARLSWLLLIALAVNVSIGTLLSADPGADLTPQ